ncbi:MAG: hypothetical protein ABW321_19880 [Polyangiales bacterium]
MTKRSASVFRARFVGLCTTLDIGTRLEATASLDMRYELAVSRVRDVIADHALEGEKVYRAKSTDHTQGVRRALDRAAGGDGVPSRKYTIELVYRLLGFLPVVPTKRWLWPRGEAQGELGPIIDHVLSPEVQRRIASACVEDDGSPTMALADHVTWWAEYLRGDRAETPPALWDVRDRAMTGPVTFYTDAYDIFASLMKRVATAKREVFFSGVGFSNSLVRREAREALLQALQNGARVRFLIFDFLEGPIERVAGHLGLTASALRRRCMDTVDALISLAAECPSTARERLEIRLHATSELSARCYAIDIVDRQPTGALYVYPRQPGSLAGPAFVATADSGIVPFYMSPIDHAWDHAVAWKDWIDTYNSWRTTRSDDTEDE